MPKAGGNSSAMIIARLLGTEGYSDFVHNQVQRYWKKRICLSQRRRRIDELEDAFSEIMSTLNIADRLVVGKFISLRAKMSFDTGLRIGLQSYAHEVDKPIVLNGNGNHEKETLKQESTLPPAEEAGTIKISKGISTSGTSGNIKIEDITIK